MDLVQVMAMTEDEARVFLEKVRWPDGPVCVCGSAEITRIKGKSARPGLMQCRSCHKQFTVTVGTVMEDSRIGLRKWVAAFHLMCGSKKGVSSLQLKRNLGIAYQTAWHLSHRIRAAMKVERPKRKLKGRAEIVEVDETYVGGRSRLGIPGRGSERKTPVMALVERGGRIRTRVIEHVNQATLKSAIRELVDRRAEIHSDEWSGYAGLAKEWAAGHKIVNHKAKEYVRGNVFTNTAESFFALLKRGVHGTFHWVSKKHLQRYCDEFGFRWDHRKVSDGTRTLQALMQSKGKRLTYNPLRN